jgi:uncharacterized protein involved in exopolysaccharide biosynthesis
MNELATVAVVLAITIAALLALAPAISLALVRSRGRGLPPSLAIRLNEEWSGELEAIPDRATKLAFAIGIRLTRRKAFAGLGGDAMTTPEMSPRRSAIAFFGGWKTVVAAPTILLAIVGYAASFWITPLYRSETTILVVPQRVPADVVKPTITTSVEDRLQRLTQQIMSRTRLERIIRDFNLYPNERRTGLMEDVVGQMRKDIDITIVRTDGFRVSYVGTNPRMAMRVTERLASLFIEENLRDREVLAEGTSQFLAAQAEDARKRLIELGTTLTGRRVGRNDTLPDTAVMTLEYDMLTTVYKDLLMKKEAAKIAANLERRQIGEQFKLLDPARLPERPFTPNRPFMALVGAIAGLCLGLTMMLSGLGRRSGRPQEVVTVGDTTALQS